MVALFGLVSLYVILASSWAVAGSGATLAEHGRPRRRGAVVAGAARCVASEIPGCGGGDGCTYPTERPSQARRSFHHLTFYGFLLCFASTTIATLYHYSARLAGALPFPQPAGRAGHNRRHRPAGRARRAALAEVARRPGGVAYAQRAMDVAFLVLLLLSSLTGLLLLLLRATPAMGLLLAVHLGVGVRRCSSPCPMASSFTPSTASRRCCATRSSAGARHRLRSPKAEPPKNAC